MRAKSTVLALVAALAVSLAGGCTDTAQENKEAYKTIGIRAMQNGAYDDAITAFDNALAQANGTVTMDEADICYYKAEALYRKGDAKTAEEVCDALLDLDNSLGDAYYLRGTIRLSEGKEEEALEDYRLAVRRKGQDISLYIAMHDNLEAVGKDAEAREFLQMATERSGNKPSDHALRGRAYTLMGDYQAAADELAVAIDGGDEDALLYMGQLSTLQGDQAAAKDCYTRYLSSHEEDADALNVLGCLEMENENYETALSYFDKALLYTETSAVDPKEILRNRILALEYLGRFQEARDAAAEYSLLYEADEVLAREEVFLETR